MTTAARRARRARPERVLRAPVRAALGALLGAAFLLPAVVAGSAAGGAAAVTPLPAQSASAGSTLPVQVVITGVSPQVVRPGDDLVVRATVTNTTDKEVANPRVAVRISRFLLATRTALSEWERAAPTDVAGAAAQTTDLGAPLAPRAAADVEVRVPAASLRLSASATAWGPRGIAVEVTDTGQRQGLDRTFALWYPTDHVTPTRISVVVPLTGDPVDPTVTNGSTSAPASSSARTSQLARLDNLLTVTGDRPAVGWVVDPALLATLAADAAGPDPAPASPTSSTSRRAAAQDRIAALTRASAGRDIFALGWLDPDLAALAHSGAGAITTTALRLTGAGPLPVIGSPPRTDVAWPAGPVPDRTTVELAAKSGARAVIVGADGLAARDLTYTPTGRATVPTPSGDVAALVADPILTNLLTDPTESSPATAAQRMLAESAVVAHERPSDPRHLLLAPPRGWNPDAATAAAQLAALAVAPWVSLAPVSALIGTADPSVDRTSLPTRAVAPSELPAASIEALHTARTDLTTFASIVPDPGTLIEGADAKLLAPLSLAWRADASGRAGVVRDVVASLTHPRSAVSIVPGSVRNLISRSGTFPVGLRNDLEQPVTIRVSLVPENRSLVVDGTETVTMPASSQLQARIPFHAVGSGDVHVAVTLLAPDGAAISAPTRFTVRVRADWENVGTAVVAAVLGLAFVFGIVRTIRRGQTTHRGASEAEIAKIADPRELPS